MVAPCCNYCYDKYINEDGTVDQDVIEKIEIESKNFIEKYNKEHPERPKPLIFQPVSCKCICHTKGIAVRH